MGIKKNFNSILFILNAYPYKSSSACVFVQRLIIEIAKKGVKCIVIAPQMITPSILHKDKRRPYRYFDRTKTGEIIVVYTPLYVHATSYSMMINTSVYNFTNAVMRVIRKEKIVPDAIYGHFIYSCGLAAASISKRLHIPAFLSVGESDVLLPNCCRNRGAYAIGVKKCGWRESLDSLTGIISVSESTRERLLSGGFISDSTMKKTAVIPNGINLDAFHPSDREAARRRLGFPLDAFIVAFVGAFNENKGALRLCKALNQCGDVKAVFIGRDGDCRPDYKGALFIGQCVNEMVPLYLSASNIFVLPTRSEGCCNAILEALACGLPVVSSDLPFNDEILTMNDSILISPDNIDQIAQAIQKLKDDDVLRSTMSQAALNNSNKHKICERAEKILSYMGQVL